MALEALALGALDAMGEGGSNEGNFSTYEGLLDELAEFKDKFAED